MPHAELKYSSDLSFALQPMLQAIEDCILQHDAGAGECKGRAYPTDHYHLSHIAVEITMLTKAHRDDAFTIALRDDLQRVMKSYIHQNCYFSLNINYANALYITNQHSGA